MPGRVVSLWALILAVSLGLAHVGAAATAPEYHVKAAFLYKFATYIHWSTPTGAVATTPFVIGIIGKDPFGPALKEVVQRQRVQGRAIRIMKLRRLEEAPLCNVLFVSSSERGNLRQIFAALGGAPVLTVGDVDQFAELGGMINLIITADNRIRFDINKGAIDRAGLKVPPQVLQLARIVDEPRLGGR